MSKRYKAGVIGRTGAPWSYAFLSQGTARRFLKTLSSA